VRHPGRHLPKAGQPFFSLHLLFQVPDLREILEDTDQSRRPPLLMKRRERHPQNQAIAVGPLAFDFEPPMRILPAQLVRRPVGMPIEHVLPAASPHPIERIAGRFLRRGIERRNAPPSSVVNTPLLMLYTIFS